MKFSISGRRTRQCAAVLAVGEGRGLRQMSDLRAQLIKRLAKLGVEHRPMPGREDGFASLCYVGKAFAHFHTDHELDIRLTKAIIDREGLFHPAGSVAHPKRT